MREVNRSAIVVIPKQPFLDWLRSVDPTSAGLSLSDLEDEPTVYLVKECESDEDFSVRLQQIAPAIFADQLDGWWRVQSDWPARRTIRKFRHWFDCRFHSVVLDLDDGPISKF